MNHNYRNGIENDLQVFKDFKTRFDLLKKELHDIYEEWGEIDRLPPDRHHTQRHNELVSHEREVLQELHHILKSADEMLGQTLERSR